MTASKTILIVDDEKEITDLVEIYLKNEGFNVCKFYRAEGVLDLLKKQSVDLAILDVMLPDQNGFDLLRDIRQNWFMPVIMLTAKIQDTDKITGLTLGADDYITKPFSTKVLFSRIKAVLRRNKQSGYYSAGFAVDYANMTVKKDGQNIMLTPTEFRLLNVLLKNKGVIVTRDSLLKEIWDDYEYYIDNNTLSVHMSRLREKIGSENISTIRGVGYRWED